MLIKRSNSMQQYVDIYSLPRHSTCFGCHAHSTRLAHTSPDQATEEGTVPLPWRTPEVADTVFTTPDDGCMTPETCRVTWQRINVYILLHRVGPLLTLNHDARNHVFNPLNPELNPICYLLALLGAHHFLHVSRIRVKLLTLRLLMSYMYGAPILDVSRSHTTTQHSR